jgi:hypothetical protein
MNHPTVSDTTIQEYVLGRGRRSIILLFVWVAMISGIGILLSDHARNYLPIIALPGIMAWWWFRSSIKCPKCGKNIASVVEQAALPFTWPPDTCPYCNLSFNEPMPPSTVGRG